jgi:2-amino-4-hydroxy-6-hydroxymethyldihydropteridine diphosphokinase
MREIVYLSVGSNIGKREDFLEIARNELKKYGSIIDYSFIYESSSWGFISKNTFLNQCLKFETELSPEDLLSVIRETEKMAGRKRTGIIYQDRTLDVDILFFGNLIIKTGSLQIPHPLLEERKFVLLPLNDIASNFKHPVKGKTIQVLLFECPDNSVLRRLGK